jgi:hypothetical protein
MKRLLKPKRDVTATPAQQRAISAPCDKPTSEGRRTLNIKLRLQEARAVMMAEFALKQRIERLRFVDEVVNPKLNQIAMEAGSHLEIPEYSIYEDQNDN